MKICIHLGFDLTFDLKTNDSDGLGKAKILQNTRRVVQKATLHMLLLMLKWHLNLLRFWYQNPSKIHFKSMEKEPRKQTPVFEGFYLAKYPEN